ncbi:MAG: hypothetical protein JST90_10155 [Bacteroidetes bacterium]|nr:hypothetical protein [Bacteroidota bacterium]
MKATISKALPVIMVFVTLSISAQINTGIGYMHGTNKKNDTSTVSRYDADKALAKKDHADTVVIKRTPTAASEARDARIERERKENAGNTDTTAGTATTTADDNGAASSSTATYISTVNGDCISPAWRYAAVGLGLLSLLLILLLVMGRKKDEPRRA